LILLVPALAVLVVASGCGGDGKKPQVQSTTPDDTTDGEKTAVAAKGTGTLKGRAVFEGDTPTPEDLKTREDFQKANDRVYCSMGPTVGQTWAVGPDKGVMNVVVWLKPPDGKYFDIPKEMRDLSKAPPVKIDQPFCAFEPHVVVLFPSYYDPESGRQKSTGQVFKVANSATIGHNTKWSGTSTINPGDNITLAKKEGDKIADKELNVKPDPRPITLACDIHKWMSAYAWAFDHPYAAVTNEKGEYEIKNAPAGAEVFVAAWHEGAGYLLPEMAPSAKGQPITLKEGDITTLDLKVRKK
jgi:hypothetical protein